MRRFLVIRFSSLGDVILTSAPVLNLKVTYPDSMITFLTKERYRSIVDCFGGVDDLVTIRDSSSAADLVRAIMHLDDIGYDAIIDLHGSLRSWLARKTVSSSETLTYPKRRVDRARIVKWHAIPRSWPHTIDLYNKALETLGALAVCRRPVLHPPALAPDLKARLVALRAGGPMIVIAPGAAHPNKQWPTERFVEVARLLHESHGAGIVWATTSTDESGSQAIRELSELIGLELIDSPVEVLAGVIEQAAVTIANDSGVAHLSSAVGTPALAVFGPTHPALGFAPRGLLDAVMQVEEPCRPCSRHGRTPCFREERYCFTRISAAMVHTAAGRLIDRRTAAEPALLVDRDGTIIADRDYLVDPEGIEPIPGALQALRKARDMGFRIVVLSNQSGVARGLFGLEAVEKVNQRFLSILAASGVVVDGLYFCPHLPGGSVPEFSMPCNCRKPAPGMAEDAARSLNIDVRRSCVIGDKLDDVNLGHVLGARPFLVRTGHGRNQEHRIRGSGINGRVVICDDLPAVVQRIGAFGSR